jgi:hypothetical protein
MFTDPEDAYRVSEQYSQEQMEKAKELETSDEDDKDNELSGNA